MRSVCVSPGRLSVALVTILASSLVAATAAASSLGKITVTPSFETAGVIVQVDGDQGNATVEVEVRRHAAKLTFHKAHRTVRFEPGAFGTSLFGLTPGQAYDVMVTLTDPDGGGGSDTTTFRARAEPKDPKPARVRWVGPSGQDAAGAGASKGAPYATISYALAQAMPGDQIRVLDGTYGPVSAAGVHGSADHPIVVVADDASKKPVVDGAMAGTAFELDDAAYVVVDGLEIKNGGDDGGGNGFYLRGSSHCTLRNSFVHDNGHNDVLIAKADQYSGGVLEGGFHLVEDNEIADTDFDPCDDESNVACPRQTYYGVKLDNNPGGGTVFRRNHIHGHDDNMSPCGDEDSARNLQDGQAVLALVGNGGPWSNHDLEIYDNTVEDARDDGMELDGICVNARIWHNTIKNAQNAFSAAPVMPGPYFFVRNVATGNWGPSDSGFKTNTNGDAAIPSRHVFVYHNTFVRSNKGAVLNLWFAQPGQHDVPLHDFVYENNVFMAAAGGPCTTAYNEGMEQPSFDGNVWYTTDTAKVFQWWDGTQVKSYDSFADYQSGTHQDANGAFGEPGLNADFTPKKGALVVDRGLPIAGINDTFGGKAPDVGAFELGEKPPPMGAGGAGSGGGGAGAGEGSGGKSPSGAGGGGDGGDGKDSGGCGCVVAGSSSRDASGAFLLLALTGLARRLSGRRRRCERPRPKTSAPVDRGRARRRG